MNEERGLIFAALAGILKKWPDYSLDVLLGCPDLDALAANTQWRDIESVHRGRFSISVPLDVQKVTTTAKNGSNNKEVDHGALSTLLAQNMDQFEQCWNRWIEPRLWSTHHNAVLFDEAVCQVVRPDREPLYRVEIRFEWLLLKCSFASEDKAGFIYQYRGNGGTPNKTSAGDNKISLMTTYNHLMMWCYCTPLFQTNADNLSTEFRVTETEYDQLLYSPDSGDRP
jgi:hypothetical protein